jgi:dienelactone hydrolase
MTPEDGGLSDRHDIGDMHHFLEAYLTQRRYSLAYRRGSWAQFEQWKITARAKVVELLHYFPSGADLSPRTYAVSEEDDLREEEIEFSSAKDVRVHGIVLTPSGQHGRLPAVVALHDHGGFYYYGKEKVIGRKNEPAILAEFKKSCYGGRSWATEIARRGYVVLSIDALCFGTRRLDERSLSDETWARTPSRLRNLPRGSDEYIQEYNQFCGSFEPLLMKHILAAGTTWPGILLFDDRRSVDYLLTRTDVDPERIGCCGLSIGGFRSAHLAALDPRIKCAVVTAWMSTYDSLLRDKLRNHTYMIYLPGLTGYLDLPDVASLTAPRALLVQQCTRDSLYHMDGMQASCQKISSVYEAIGHLEKFRCVFYDTHHEFNVSMQEDAFRWIDQWLKSA